MTILKEMKIAADVPNSFVVPCEIDFLDARRAVVITWAIPDSDGSGGSTKFILDLGDTRLDWDGNAID